MRKYDRDIYQNPANMVENTVELTVYMMPVGSIPILELETY